MFKTKLINTSNMFWSLGFCNFEHCFVFRNSIFGFAGPKSRTLEMASNKLSFRGFYEISL